MSTHNKPIFKFLGDFSKYGRKRNKSLNLKNYKLQHRLITRNSNIINTQEA